MMFSFSNNPKGIRTSLQSDVLGLGVAVAIEAAFDSHNLSSAAGARHGSLGQLNHSAHFMSRRCPLSSSRRNTQEHSAFGSGQASHRIASSKGVGEK